MAEVYRSDSEIIALQDYICSLNFSTLPRILEIHSGVYFQGSVYEISGNECCLSTGEFIKIIHIELQKVVCENMDNNSKFDLPLNYSGHFKLIPEEFPFTSIEEIIKSTEIRKQSSEVITFQSMTDIVTDHAVIQKGEPITVISTVVHEGQMYADCLVDGYSEQFQVRLPFMLKGQFNECEGDNSYTVQDIIESQTLTRRRVRLAETEGICVPKHFNGALIISPVYEIQAIMNLRKEVVKIPSTLEVDVRDVTEEQKDAIFIKPLSLTDISNQPQQMFPIIVEIIDAPDHQAPFKAEWFHLLRKGRNLIIYKKMMLKKVLATSVHNKISHHFLISEHYKGTFRRRPREFPTVFDLCNAFTPEDPLHIVVTNECTWNEGELSSLCIGDRLITMFKTTSQVAIEGVLQNLDVVVCSKLPEDEEEEDEDVAQPLMLPLYLEGRFVEEIHDTKKYKISEIHEKFKLPFQVKVTSKDPSLPTDSLTSFPTIKLEEIIEVPTLIASYLENPSECFSIPVEWVTMTVQVLEDYCGEDCCYENIARVEELTNTMYYNLLRCSTPSQCPPPRPPKQPSKGTQSRPPAPIQNPSHSPVPDNKQLQPPLLPERASICPKSTIVAETKALPPTSGKLFSKQHTEATPNEYTKSKKMKKKKTPKLPEVEKLTCDDDHDYEQVKEIAPTALYYARPWSPSTEMKEETYIDNDHDYEQVEEVTLMTLQAMRMWTP